MHYIGDCKTAEYCLLKAIEFARKFPDYIAGGNLLSSPWRRGRHYIMNNSFVPAEKVREIALHLQSFYTELVCKDPKNEVFIRFLDKAEIEIQTYPVRALND